MSIQRTKRITRIPADESPDGLEFDSILETFHSEYLTGDEETLLDSLETQVKQDGYQVVHSSIDVNVLRVPQVVGYLLYRSSSGTDLQ